MTKSSLLKPKTSRLRPILVSGIQPTGRLHIGNYLGALKNFVELQNSGNYRCIFIIVDLHSLTARHDPKEKPGQILEVAADYLAAGLDAKRSIILLQSAVPAHSELCWILSTITPFGELRRMTQFKEKSAQFSYQMTHPELGLANRDELSAGADVGLFTYPILMTADIILYDAKYVPVGHDQLQHLEFARTLTRKFNYRFGDTFVEPEPLLTHTPRIMSLEDPSAKMSKSRSHPGNCIYLDDAPADIEKKIKRAVTDSGSEIRFDKKNKPAISNLLSIYSGFSGKTIRECEQEFGGKGYGYFKAVLTRTVIDHLGPIRKNKAALLKKPNGLKKVLATGSAAANRIANKKMAEVKERIGLAI